MNKQESIWISIFGEKYTDRNKFDSADSDLFYSKHYGISRTEIYKEFLDDLLPKDSKILEIGCNIGIQLNLLQKLGYNNLWGIDLQEYALDIGRKQYKGLNLCCASVYDLPFKDNYFDLIFTNGLLIHIHPNNLKFAIQEMYRVSNKYLLSWEYYNDIIINVDYHGYSEVLWKANYPQLFLDLFPNLNEIKIKKITQINDSSLIDIIGLLGK